MGTHVCPEAQPVESLVAHNTSSEKSPAALHEAVHDAELRSLSRQHVAVAPLQSARVVHVAGMPMQAAFVVHVSLSFVAQHTAGGVQELAPHVIAPVDPPSDGGAGAASDEDASGEGGGGRDPPWRSDQPEMIEHPVETSATKLASRNFILVAEAIRITTA